MSEVVLRNAISYVPERLRGEPAFQFFCELVDFVINNQYVPDLGVVSDQFNLESSGFDNEWMLRLLGAVNLQTFDASALDNKTYSYLISAIDEMKGNVQGLSFALSLLGVKADIFQWFDINEKIADGDHSWGRTPYPAFSVVVDVSVNNVGVILTPEYERNLKDLCKKLLWACIELLELRVSVAFEDSAVRPMDRADYIFTDFYFDELARSRFICEHFDELWSGFVDVATVAGGTLIIGFFNVGSATAIIVDGANLSGRQLSDAIVGSPHDFFELYVERPRSSSSFVLDGGLILDRVVVPMDDFVGEGYHVVAFDYSDKIVMVPKSFVGGNLVGGFFVASLSGFGVMDSFSMVVDDVLI